MFHIIARVFDIFIGQPIFNVLILLVALIPGHDLGITIIIFTILVRVAMYPLLKKQLHNAIAMKKLQPELKRIKKEAAGDRQKESQLVMAMYKEKEINPFGSFGVILIQLPIFIALYAGISRLVKTPKTILSYSYSWTHHLTYMQHIASNMGSFNHTFLGLVDLTKPALGHSGVYWPAMIIVILSAVIQYIQSKQLMMTDKNAKSIRQIFKSTSSGEEVDQAEIQAATARFTIFFIPFMLFLVTVGIASALPLYWLVSSLVAYYQQTNILRRDVVEMEAEVDSIPVAAEIIDTPKPKKPKPASSKHKNSKKRR